ncbi:MAG: hypothetical protein D6743_10400 [Calditrichaeota bacterium]|nr:MAG: hypothetical protein D6743_10400 [Calditrichota bacterium]
MQSADRFRRPQDECPPARRIEEILLRAHRFPQVYREFEQHVLVCRRCRNVVHRIQLFYGILEAELNQGEDARIIEFVKTLEAKVQP